MIGRQLVLISVACLLVAAAAVSAVALLDRYNHAWDLSIRGRNTLQANSADILQQFDGPLRVTAVIPQGHPARIGVGEFFSPYQRAHADLELSFFDPASDPEKARAQGYQLGEIVIQHGQAQERVTTLSESDVVNALARLLRAGDRYVTFLASNGERQIERQANHDISIFADHLKQRGLKLRSLGLGSISTIPDNSAVLVLASPSLAYSSGDIAAITDYLDAGGNLLWLREPGVADGLDAVARLLAIGELPGTVIDPVGLTKFGNPAYAVADWASSHAILSGFQQSVVFPFASAIVPITSSEWQRDALARSSDNAWTETGPIEGNVGYDGDDEVQASHYLAVAQTRVLNSGRQQRVVIIGDGDFASNTFIDNLGNREFARRVIEWLARDDHLIEISDHTVVDADLELQMWQRLIIFMVFGLGIPLALAANGALYWWRRRHA